MRTIPTWVEKVHNSNKVEQCIYDLCFNPDGSQLIVTAGPVLLVYSCVNGTVIQTLKGHKDVIYCVSYAYDGSKFASGGADKTVIIWTPKLEALLKYVHPDAIQCIAFNPVSGILASCSITDFSFFTLEFKNVLKFKSNSRIHACTWSSDGQYFALGLANGNVSIRNVNGDEKYVIENDNSNSTPIWALSFSPKKSENEVLCVTDWSQKMTFYSIDGRGIAREKNLGFEALSLNYMLEDYILVAGCNKQCLLMSSDGVKLGTIGDEQESWIWCCKANPSVPFVVFGCQDGTIAYFQLVFSTVHGLYREKYAYRQSMTDVVVHDLVSNDLVRIKCRDWVKKIAVYKHRLAVLLRNKVVIYELHTKESNQLHYQMKNKLIKSFDCNLLVVCSEHLILCQETRLQCYTFDGKNVGQWIMDDVVRYIKVIGGAPGNEGLIVGLADGQVLKVYISNPFPITLMKSTSAILCLDLSLSKKKLAVVNDEQQCIIYDVGSNQILSQENKATSVAWNTLYEDMLCYSGGDVLNIKVNDCLPHQIKFSGYVVGVHRSKVFSLNGSNIVTLDVPLSAPMYQCLEKNLYEDAYMIANLGVTESDWKALAHAALEKFNLNVALKAFTRIKDLQHLDLIHEFLTSKEQNKESFMGDILAYSGKFKEAARFYQKAGHSHKALAMYTDMRMFDLAQEFVKSENNADKKTLIRKKAEWAKNVNEPKAAVEMFISAGDIRKAVDIAVENRWTDTLIELSRKIEGNEIEALKKIADSLNKLGEMRNAIDIFSRLGEHRHVLQIYISLKEWSSAFALVERYPELENLLYIPYAEWLVENDNFVEAQKAFHKAGKPEHAAKVLEILIENAIDEGRFDDTGYYHWILSRQYLDLARIREENQVEKYVEKFYFHDHLASIYYAYYAIQKYLEEPFTSYQPEALFNIARYLLNEIESGCPKGVTRFSILYSLAKQAKSLGGYKIARQALDNIQNLRIPSHFQDFVDISTIMVKAKPYHDNEELLIMCYRCSSYNPLVVSSAAAVGNVCLNCRQPFVFSYVTYEVLPLIEFQLEDGITDEEAVKLLQSSNESVTKSKANYSDGDFQSLLIDDSVQSAADLFTATLINLEVENGRFSPVTVNRDTLLSMDSNLVLVCKWPNPMRYRYYRNLVPELQIIACSSCFKIFHIDDYEMEVLQKGHCPFCRVKPEKEVNHDVKIL